MMAKILDKNCAVSFISNSLYAHGWFTIAASTFFLLFHLRKIRYFTLMGPVAQIRTAPTPKPWENLRKRETLIAERKAVLLQRDCLWAKAWMNICIAFSRWKWEGTEERCRCISFSFNSYSESFSLKYSCLLWASNFSDFTTTVKLKYHFMELFRYTYLGCKIYQVHVYITKLVVYAVYSFNSCPKNLLAYVCLIINFNYNSRNLK